LLINQNAIKENNEVKIKSAQAHSRKKDQLAIQEKQINNANLKQAI
jgi:hypothetical protein